MADIPGPSMWSCKNGHFYTRELGPECPECGLGLNIPHDEIQNVADSTKVEKAISDGEIPGTSKSAMGIQEWRPLRLPSFLARNFDLRDLRDPDVVWPLGGAHEQNHDDSESESEECDIPRGPELILNECDFGHWYNEVDGVCYICEAAKDGLELDDTTIPSLSPVGSSGQPQPDNESSPASPDQP